MSFKTSENIVMWFVWKIFIMGQPKNSRSGSATSTDVQTTEVANKRLSFKDFAHRLGSLLTPRVCIIRGFIC